MWERIAEEPPPPTMWNGEVYSVCEMVGSLAKVEETKAMYGTYIIYIILCECRQVFKKGLIG